MRAIHSVLGIRFFALAFAAAALTFPMAMVLVGFLAAPETRGCQSPTAAVLPLLTTMALSGFPAIAAIVLGTVAFFRVPRPRPKIRRLELALCCLPLTLILVAFAVFVVVFAAG